MAHNDKDASDLPPAGDKAQDATGAGVEAPGRPAVTLSPFEPITLPGGRAAALRDDGQVIQIGFPELGGPMFHQTKALEIADGRLRVLHDMGEDGQVITEVDLSFRWTLADHVTAVQPYIMYGQSLALNLGHDLSLTTAPVAPGRAVRYLNAGAGAQMSVSDRPGRDKADFGPCHFPESDLDALGDLVEERGESPVSASVRGFLPALPDDTGVVATNHARGGMTIVKLLPKRLAAGRGTGIQYAGLLRAAVRTQQFCAAHGRRMRQPIVSFIQGETFEPADWTRYGDHLVTLQAALTEDLGKITGSTSEVLVFTDQTAVISETGRTYSPDHPPAALVQLRVSQAQPGRFICVGPKYFLPRRATIKGRGDPVHLLPSASLLLGEYHGRAIRQALGGQTWVPLHVASYRRTGAVIRLGIAGGDGSPLALDTDLVRDTSSSLHGLRWVQEGGDLRQVTELTLLDREIVVKLDGDPGSAGRDFVRAALTIGLFGEIPRIDDGPTTGGRTNIRDTCPDLSCTGHPMYNWLCHDWFWETSDLGPENRAE